MAPNGILETVLYTQDLAAAEAFYREVLGLEVTARVPERHVFFRCGNQMLLLFNPDVTSKTQIVNGQFFPTHGATGPGHLCFRATSDEIDAWKVRLADHGVAIESEVAWPNGGRSIYFRDPAGNSLEFAEPRIWGLE